MDTATIQCLLCEPGSHHPFPNMDLKEIEKVPHFDSDVDPLLLANLKGEEDRLLAQAMSKLRQESRWAAETARVAHNISIQNYNFIKKYGGPIMIGTWIAGVALAALVTKMFSNS